MQDDLTVMDYSAQEEDDALHDDGSCEPVYTNVGQMCTESIYVNSRPTSNARESVKKTNPEPEHMTEIYEATYSVPDRTSDVPQVCV